MQTLDFAIELLNTIEVKGKTNLDRLLAVIVALEQLKNGQETVNIDSGIGETINFEQKKGNSK